MNSVLAQYGKLDCQASQDVAKYLMAIDCHA